MGNETRLARALRRPARQSGTSRLELTCRSLAWLTFARRRAVTIRLLSRPSRRPFSQLIGPARAPTARGSHRAKAESPKPLPSHLLLLLLLLLLRASELRFLSKCNRAAAHFRFAADAGEQGKRAGERATSWLRSPLFRVGAIGGGGGLLLLLLLLPSSGSLPSLAGLLLRTRKRAARQARTALV